MSESKRFAEIAAHFDELSELGIPEREARLAELFARDAAVAQEVRALLLADEAAAGFIEPPDPALLESYAKSSAAPAEPELEIDSRLGAYRVVKKIAEGGMGAVYLASRADREFESFVAIKVLRRELRSPQAEARLRHERQTLASLTHPLIARLLDGGSMPDGRPYLVMEYIEGLPIDRACAERALPLAARLELLLQVCGAVSHAHHRLVVHRDLKPNNILVTPEGTPRLLDFGIAKLLSGGDSGSSGPRTQVAFTPAYASPEQKRGDVVGTASDVFSLGRLLAALLPEDMPPLARAEMLAIAARASAEREEERYPSVERFAQELERFLREEPLEAYPSTALYRARKFARRHSIALVVAAAGSAGLLAAGFALFAAWHAASAERVLATEARKGAEAATAGALASSQLADARAAESDRNAAQYKASLDFLRRLFAAPRARGAGPETKVIDFLEDARSEVDRSPGAAGVAVEVRRMLGLAFVELAEYEAGLHELELVHEQLRNSLGAADPRTVVAQSELGHALDEAGQRDRALALLENALAAMDAAPQHFQPSDRVSTLHELAKLHLHRREHARGLEHARRAIDLAKMTDLRAPLLSDVLSTASSLEISRAPDSAQGRQYIEEAIEVSTAQFGESHPNTQDLQLNLAEQALSRGQTQRAIDIAEPILAQRRARHPRAHPALLMPLSILGRAHLELDHHDEAIKALREALLLHRESRGADHPDTSPYKNNLAMALRRGGQLDEAHQLLTEVLAEEERHYGRMTSEYAKALTNLGVLEEARQRYDEAHAHFLKALEISRSLNGDRHIQTARTWVNVATTAYRLGQLEASSEAFEKAVAVRRELLPPTHPHLADALYSWARTEIARERWQLAADLLREAADVLQRAESPVRSRIVKSLLELAMVREKLLDPAGARAALEEARESAIATGPKGLADLRTVLARLIAWAERTGDAEAATAYRTELEALGQAGG